MDSVSQQHEEIEEQFKNLKRKLVKNFIQKDAEQDLEIIKKSIGRMEMELKKVKDEHIFNTFKTVNFTYYSHFQDLGRTQNKFEFNKEIHGRKRNFKEE
jgi:hypothetical protein